MLVLQIMRESRMPYIVHNFAIFDSSILKISAAKGYGKSRF